jgi:Na+-driven multidrug efflux pump
MSGTRPTGERLAALFILGVVLFNPPFLSIFNRTAHVFGVPLLYLYLFFAWALLIALAALLVEAAEGGERASQRDDSDVPDDAEGADK